MTEGKATKLIDTRIHIYIYIYPAYTTHSLAHMHLLLRKRTYPFWNRGSEIMPRNRFKQQTRTDSVTVPKRISR